MASDAADEDDAAADEVVEVPPVVDGPALVVVMVMMIGARLVAVPLATLTVDVIIAVVEGAIDEAVNVDVVSCEDCVKVDVKVVLVNGVVVDEVIGAGAVVSVEVRVESAVDESAAMLDVESTAMPAIIRQYDERGYEG